MRPLRCETTSCANSAGDSRRPLQADRALVELALRGGPPARQVLRLQRLHDLADADARRLQRLRADLDGQLALDAADDVTFGDAGDAAQPPRDAGIGDPRQLGAVSPATTAPATRSAGRSDRTA